MSFARPLLTGEQVDGSVEISPGGQNELREDWYFEILNGDGRPVFSWQGQWRTTKSYQFKYSAPATGIYTMRVTHYSSYQRKLFISVSPTGWVDSDYMQYFMPTERWGGRSFFLVKTLKSGDIISGLARNTGPQPAQKGLSGTWSLEILDGDGGTAYSWQGQWPKNSSRWFSFTVPSAGIYQVRVTNKGDYLPQVSIRVAPPGWAYRQP